MIIINIFKDYMYNIDIIIKSSLGGIILFEELKTFVAVVDVADFDGLSRKGKSQNCKQQSQFFHGCSSAGRTVPFGAMRICPEAEAWLNILCRLRETRSAEGRLRPQSGGVFS